MNDSEMQAIPISEVISQPRVLTDIYIRLSSNRFILIVKAGMATPVESLKSYQKKGVERVFLSRTPASQKAQLGREASRPTRTDSQGAPPSIAPSERNNGGGAQRIERASADGERIAIGSLQAPAGSVLKPAYAQVASAMELFASIGFEPGLLRKAQEVQESVLVYIQENEPLLGLVSGCILNFRDAVEHAVLVSMFSSMLGMRHSGVHPEMLETLALGGFLHDLGKGRLPEEIVDKPVDKMKRDEWTIYSSHPEVGKQLLLQSRCVSDDVAATVYEHHELADGSGYPQGAKDYQISLFGQIVSLGNAFLGKLDERARKAKTGITGTAFSRVAWEFETEEQARYNKGALQAMVRLCRGVGSVPRK